MKKIIILLSIVLILSIFGAGYLASRPMGGLMWGCEPVAELPENENVYEMSTNELKMYSHLEEAIRSGRWMLNPPDEKTSEIIYDYHFIKVDNGLYSVQWGWWDAGTPSILVLILFVISILSAYMVFRLFCPKF